MQKKPCFKNPNGSPRIDLFLTNDPHTFSEKFRIVYFLVQSIFYKLIITVLKYSFIELKTKESYCRDYKNFNSNLFRV